MFTNPGHARRTPAGVLLRAVLLGAFIAGTLDIADAVLFSYAWSGVPPSRVLQAIASGLLGRSAFAGGMPTALLGLAIHFCIALTVAAVYAIASQRLPILARHAPAAGIVYGIAVFFVMRHIVLPLSSFRGGAFAWPPFINGVLIHAFGVGLPIALIVHGAGERTAGRAESAARERERSDR